MARGQQLRAVSVITIDGVQYVWDDLPEEVRAEYRARMLANIGRQFGESLSRRPEEAKKVLAAYEAGEL